jgi:hypothetical protein
MEPLSQLTTYVLAAMVAWCPKVDPGRLRSVAEDIAAVSLEQEPLFKDDAARSRTALLLASVARYESNFAPWVDDGRCNDPAWRESQEGRRTHRGSDCDGGRAYSLWQVHPYAGASGPAMLADRRTAVREAVARLRVSLDAGRGLCWYTGETGDCPKGEIRLRTALVWAVGHPFPPPVVAKLGN